MKVAEIVNCCKTMNDNEKECKDCPCYVECDALLIVLRDCKPMYIKTIMEEDY